MFVRIWVQLLEQRPRCQGFKRETRSHFSPKGFGSRLGGSKCCLSPSACSLCHLVITMVSPFQPQERETRRGGKDIVLRFRTVTQELLTFLFTAHRPQPGHAATLNPRAPGNEAFSWLSMGLAKTATAIGQESSTVFHVV